jgi:CRISPR/Cas system-associated exonuclease Cas4 (RecB family)
MPHIEYRGSDGKIWPSSTQLTRLLPADWVMAWYKRSVEKKGYQGWLDNLKLSEEGKLIGTQVHERLEHLVLKQPIVEYDTRAGEYAQAIYNVLNPKIEEYVKIEPHLVSEELKIHGTADLIARLNYQTGLWILDYKTSYKKDISHPIQLAIYAKSWNEQNTEQIDQGAIIRIDKKSKNLNVKIDEYLGLKQYLPVIKALREIWSYVNEKE